MNYKDEQIKKFREKFGHYRGLRPDGTNQLDIEQFLLESIDRAYLRGKLTAYGNVAAWTEQCDPSNEMVISAHRAAVSSTKDDLT